MKPIILTILFLFSIGLCKATHQQPDTIIYNKETLFLNFAWLGFPWPFGHYYGDGPCSFRGLGSSCIRGYIATWEIQNDSLFLKKISMPDTMGNLQNYFDSKKIINEKVFVDWYSGYLIIESSCKERIDRIPCDTSMEYNDEPYKYFIMEINNGTLVRKEEYDYYTWWSIEMNCFSGFAENKIRMFHDYRFYHSKLIEERRQQENKNK